jgi:LPXTG-site transpeptidase (sortase) family protein
MTVTTAEGIYDYRVERTLIVNPEDVYVLDPTERATLTLVTCYPFTFIGHAPQRFIVQATLVAERPR